MQVYKIPLILIIFMRLCYILYYSIKDSIRGQKILIFLFSRVCKSSHLCEEFPKIFLSFSCMLLKKQYTFQYQIISHSLITKIILNFDMLTFQLHLLQTEKNRQKEIWCYLMKQESSTLLSETQQSGCILAAIFFVNDTISPVHVKLHFCTFALVF